MTITLSLFPRILILAFLLLLSVGALAAVKPHSLFSDGAVLQQGVVVPVWGTANDGEKVSVAFQGQSVSTVARSGRWMVRLAPLTAGGPFTMTVAGDSNTVEIKNVLVGEVWVCSGQSNMEFALRYADNGEQAMASSADPKLRILGVPWYSSDIARRDFGKDQGYSWLTPGNKNWPFGTWLSSEPDTVGDFSAVGYYFGRDLRRALNVPVGIINASVGGTIAQAWISRDSIISSSDGSMAMFTYPRPPWAIERNHPSGLFNGMVRPLMPFAIKGVIWYQGESNAGNSYSYKKALSTLIANWRQDWQQGDFPFLIVQLPGFMKIQPEPADSAWAEMREAQYKTTLDVPETGIAVITDSGEEDNIHPRHKEPVGERLALAAEGIAYGKKIAYKGPTYKSMKIKGDSIILSFDNIGGGLVARDGDLKGFAIAGQDKKFCNAQASILGKTILVRSSQVSHPTAVRFGWADFPVVNLFNKKGLPAVPFRTDDYPMITGPH